MVRNLKYLRNIKGISQNKLAEIVNVSQQSINKYENHNVEPDISTLIKLADYFNTSVDFLIGHTEINRIIEKVERCDLNSDEMEVVEKYRIISIKEKESIKLILQNYISKS